MKAYRGEVMQCHPPFPATSEAVCIDTDAPLAEDVEDIKYSEEDNAVIEQWIRENLGSAWHSLGTCKMAAREDAGVVNENLSVYGVEALKIVDMSIPPSNVAANTKKTALVIGEKAADILIQELCLGT